ncbi:hypothetical protein HDV57DRAFT_499131 [Trichoderma longibrachiatum]
MLQGFAVAVAHRLHAVRLGGGFCCELLLLLAFFLLFAFCLDARGREENEPRVLQLDGRAGGKAALSPGIAGGRSYSPLLMLLVT